MIDFVQTVADLDQSSDIHVARLLILLDSFSEDDQNGAVEGLTKLAKLDFLLRYPVMLERALKSKGKSTESVKLEDYERQSVESEMVRYRFGPWDHRYREFLNILVGKGLAVVNVEGRKVVISITSKGREKAKELSKSDLFEPYYRRSKLVRRHFDLRATYLMNFIYTTFPEIISLRSNAPITV
jgi:hypothetical protein